MASGKFESGYYGGAGSRGPWVSLSWSEHSQSIVNNTTTLDLTLTFHWDANINYTFHNRSGSLQGHSFNYSGSVSGTSGSRVLKTQRITVTHNSDGNRSIALSGYISNLGLNYSGVNVSTMSVSGTAYLTKIDRTSEITGATIANLKDGSGARLDVTSTTHNTNFYHLVTIYDGSKYIWDSGYFKGASAGGYTINATGVKRIIDRMPNSTTKTLWLGLGTYTGSSGTGWVGTTSINVTVNLDSSVKPTPSGFSVGVAGKGHDNSLGMYVQGVSKVTGSYSGSAGYGATIASETFTIRRKTTNTDVQTMTGRSATSRNPVASEGVYEAWGTITDSRGRYAYTNTIEFRVYAYKPPTITDFTAERRKQLTDGDSRPRMVDIVAKGVHSHLNRGNRSTMTVYRRVNGTSSWSSINTNTSAVGSGSNNSSFYSPNNEVYNSYEFRAVLKDQFGNSAEAIVSVPTQRVVLDIHKDLGIGIGKLHEQGVLDVDGDAYFKGKLIAEVDNAGSVLNERGLDIRMPDPAGEYIASLTGKNLSISQVDTSNLYLNRNLIQAINGLLSVNGTNVIEEGASSAGEWIKFQNGTMISRGFVTKTMPISSAWGSMYHANVGKIKFPLAFSAVPYVEIINSSAHAVFMTSSGNHTSTTQTGNIDIYTPVTYNSRTYSIGFVAIGRWK